MGNNVHLFNGSYLLKSQKFSCFNFQHLKITLKDLNYLSSLKIYFIIYSIFFEENIYYLSLKPHYYYVKCFGWALFLLLKKIYCWFKTISFKSFNWFARYHFLFLQTQVKTDYNEDLYLNNCFQQLYFLLVVHYLFF